MERLMTENATAFVRSIIEAWEYAGVRHDRGPLKALALLPTDEVAAQVAEHYCLRPMPHIIAALKELAQEEAP